MFTIYITNVEARTQYAVSHPIKAVALFIANHLRFSCEYTVRVWDSKRNEYV
jgi:hypothetical protein